MFRHRFIYLFGEKVVIHKSHYLFWYRRDPFFHRTRLWFILWQSTIKRLIIFSLNSFFHHKTWFYMEQDYGIWIRIISNITVSEWWFCWNVYKSNYNRKEDFSSFHFIIGDCSFSIWKNILCKSRLFVKFNW